MNLNAQSCTCLGRLICILLSIALLDHAEPPCFAIALMRLMIQKRYSGDHCQAPLMQRAPPLLLCYDDLLQHCHSTGSLSPSSAAGS